MMRQALLAFAGFLLASCSGGRDKLIADLQSARPEVRALAVKHLGEKFDPDDVSLFTQAARDPVPVVRAEAMTALGKSQDPRVVDLLGEALSDPDDLVQLKAAAALAGTKSPKARQYLTLQYSRPGRSTRIAIVQGLKGANIPGAMASVVAAEATSIWERNVRVLEDGTLPERVGAAEALGRSGRPDAVNRLVPLLGDSQVVLAAAATRGLGLAGDKRAVGPVSALLKENYPELREAACDTLAALGDVAVATDLLAVAEEKSLTSAAATRALIALPESPETAAALCQLVMSGADADAQAAGLAMRRRGGCPAEPILEKLRSGTPQVALSAIVALGPVLNDVAQRVTPFLTSNDWRTRQLAADALAELGDPSTAAQLLKAWEAEVKALEPVRADWVPAALPLEFAPGFDPAQPAGDADTATLVRARTADLFRRVEALDAQRAQQMGKSLVKAAPPRETVDDGTDEQVAPLASLMRALARLHVQGTAERVRPYLRDGNVRLRSSAYVALATLGEDAHEGLLDHERTVRSETAQALVAAGPDGQRAVLQALATLSGDRTPLLEALRGVAAPADQAGVLLALVKEGGAEAGLAASILSEMKAPDAVPGLLELLDDPTAVARPEVLLALGRLRDARAVDVIARDLYSDRPEVRVAAATALGDIGGATDLEALDALKGDYYRRVREAATTAASHSKEATP